MSQPHERSSKRSAAEAVQEQQEAGQALLEQAGGAEPADAPGGSKGAPAGPGRPAEAGARLVVRPGAPRFCSGSLSALARLCTALGPMQWTLAV